MHDKFDKLCDTIYNSMIATILIFIIGFAIAATICYNGLDFKRATYEDYEPLYKNQQSIINEFDTVYTLSNTAIDITDSNIIVFIYGNDCYIKAYFDKTKTYQHTEKIDTTDPLWFNISLLLFISIIGSIIFYIVFVVLLAIIYLLLRQIKIKYTRKKESNH